MSIFFKFSWWIIFLGTFAVVPFAAGWDCSVSMSGPSAIKNDQTVTLIATGEPSGGSYSWWRIPNLVPNGSSADLTAFEPSSSDYIRVGVNYTTPRGKKCSVTKYLWYERCCANINGPNTVFPGETIILIASGEPVGGIFHWSNSNPQVVHLEATGNSVSLTGLAIGKTTITLTYDNPETELHCKSYLDVNVLEKCNIELYGTYITSVGDYGHMTAVTYPAGGDLTWTSHPNIKSINNDQIYHGTELPGTYTYEATYKLMDGSSCSNTFDVTFVKINSISGPFCVNSGATLSKNDFTYTTLPEGHNLLVNISPLSYLSTLPYFDETVTASIGSGFGNDATTTLAVINSSNKFSSNINVSVPNYVSEPLKTLGLSEKLDLDLTSKFDRFWECCSTFASSSVDGSTNVKLNVSGGPFTIVGIPLPKNIKQYVTIDVLNIGLSGDGGAKITGNYKGCLDVTEWTGSGTLSANVSANAEAKAKFPGVFIFHGKISGNTGVYQSIKAKDTNLLVSSEWEGLDMKGMIKFKALKLIFNTNINHSLIKKNDIRQVSIPLPALN
jgi:hypothetical protein